MRTRLGTIKSKTYISRMAAQAELRVTVQSFPDGTHYHFYDARARTEAFELFYAIGGAEASAFISGYLAGRNREIVK